MNATSKGLCLLIVIVAACLSMATSASALSLQLRGGTDAGSNGPGSNIALDLFFYEGRSVDFFIGYDVISTSDEHELWLTSGGSVMATTDVKTTALILGLRYKMQTKGAWKPYFSLGIARLNTEFTHQRGLESYYERPFEQSSSGMRMGLGFDVSVSDQWSLGLEGSLLTGVPYYEDYFFGSGRQVDSYGAVTQVDLGLRYHF